MHDDDISLLCVLEPVGNQGVASILALHILQGLDICRVPFLQGTVPYGRRTHHAKNAERNIVPFCMY